MSHLGEASSNQIKRVEIEKECLGNRSSLSIILLSDERYHQQEAVGSRWEYSTAAAMRLAKTYLDGLQFAAPDTLDIDYEVLDDGTFRRKDASQDAILEVGAVRFGVPWTTVKPQQFRLLVDADGNTNSVAAGVTSDQIVEGYTVMLALLHHLFGVPVEFLESGRPGQWNPQWDHPGPLGDKQVAKHPFVKTL